MLGHISLQFQQLLLHPLDVFLQTLQASLQPPLSLGAVVSEPGDVAVPASHSLQVLLQHHTVQRHLTVLRLAVQLGRPQRRGQALLLRQEEDETEAAGDEPTAHVRQIPAPAAAPADNFLGVSEASNQRWRTWRREVGGRVLSARTGRPLSVHCASQLPA